jgi:LmbE family N-acetylglucosaminyl deacetylase
LLGAVRLSRPCRAKVIKVARPTRFRPRQVTDRLGLPGDLDLPDESIDLVIASGWHECVAFFRWSLQEVARVLKMNALAVLCLPADEERVLIAPMDATSSVRAFARRLFTHVSAATGIQGVSSPRAVLEELGFSVELVASASAQRRGHFASVELGEFSGRSPWLGQRLINGFCSRKRDSSWRANPILRDRTVLEAVICRDYRREIQRLADFVAEHRIVPAPAAPDPGLFESTAILLSPHPDDELIGAGGTLMRIAQAGGEATVVEMSNGWNSAVLSGAPGEIRRSIRLEEAARVCAEMGVRLEAWDDIRDGSFDVDRLAGRLTAVLAKIKPDYVFVPFVADPHEDHAAANLVLATAIRRLDEPFVGKVLSYEVWTFCPANFVVDISAIADRKFRLMNHYRTALRTVNYARVAQWFGGWHGYRFLRRFAQAEVFYLQSAADYLDAIDAAFPPTGPVLSA